MNSRLGKYSEKLYIIFWGKTLPENLHISINFGTSAQFFQERKIETKSGHDRDKIEILTYLLAAKNNTQKAFESTVGSNRSLSAEEQNSKIRVLLFYSKVYTNFSKYIRKIGKKIYNLVPLYCFLSQKSSVKPYLSREYTFFTMNRKEYITFAIEKLTNSAFMQTITCVIDTTMGIVSIRVHRSVSIQICMKWGDEQ